MAFCYYPVALFLCRRIHMAHGHQGSEIWAIMMQCDVRKTHGEIKKAIVNFESWMHRPICSKQECIDGF